MSRAPRLAAVRGHADLAELADHVAGVVVDAGDAVENRIADRQRHVLAHADRGDVDLLHRPGLPAVGGVQDRGYISDRPQALRAGDRQIEQRVLGAALLLGPALAAVLGLEDDSLVTHAPARLAVEEGHAGQVSLGRCGDLLPRLTAVFGARQGAAVAEQQERVVAERLDVEELVGDRKTFPRRGRHRLAMAGDPTERDRDQSRRQDERSAAWSRQ